MSLHIVGRPETPITDLKSVSTALGDLIGNDGFWELSVDPRIGSPDTKEVCARAERVLALIENITISLGEDINHRNIRHLGEALKLGLTSRLVHEFFEDMAQCRKIAHDIRTTGQRYRQDSLHPLRDKLKRMKLMIDTITGCLEIVRERGSSPSSSVAALAKHTQVAALELVAANQAGL